MKPKILFLLFLLSLGIPGFCAQLSKIHLNDGSVIEAEVVSLENGVYTLNTGSLGQVRVDASKVGKIEAEDASSIAPRISIPTNPANANMQSQIDSLKTTITNDPRSMQIVNDLAKDPQIQEIAKDPDIANAAKSGDIKALMSNEKFKQLIENPKIKEIGERVKEQNQGN